MSNGGNRLLMGVSQRADTQPVFKTWVSEPVIASFDDADLPHPVEHFAVVLGVYLFFVVTALALVGAGILLCSRF